MRLERGMPVGGLDPQTARSLARACHTGWIVTGQVADRLKVTTTDAEHMLRLLEEAGFVERRDSLFPGETDEWNATVAGGALTMASFLKPISRARVDTLLEGVLDRAAAYDADEQKPYVITGLVVFGSYLRVDVDKLGDLDLGITFAERRPGSASPAVLLDYAKLSGRRFPHIVARIGWAEVELLQLLRSRSPYINVHTDDVSKITDDWRVVYPQASRPT